MNRWKLPTSVCLHTGVDVYKEWKIETDYVAIIDVLEQFENPEYDDADKFLYCLMALIKDFDNLPEELYQEAYDKLVEFIDMGQKADKKIPRKVMDWEQDAPMIISAVNNVCNKEIRTQNMHWWTFLGYYMEISDKSLYSQVLNIRLKKSKGKKLEKWEQEFYRENKSLIDLDRKLTKEEIEEEQLLDELFG